jgi:hypothetical protein
MGYNFFKILDQNPKVLDFNLTENASFQKKLVKTPYFLLMKPIFWISYT